MLMFEFIMAFQPHSVFLPCLHGASLVKMFVFGVVLLSLLLLLLHRATCEIPSSCDIHGPQDSVVFNDLTQANGID
jgi:hypothetical protein